MAEAVTTNLYYMIQEFLTQTDEGLLYFGGARMALIDIEAGFWGLRRQLEALAGRRLANAVLQRAGANGGASFARAFAAGMQDETAVDLLRDCIAAYRAAGFGDFALDEVSWPIGRVRVRATHAFEAWMLQQHHHPSDMPICAYSAGVLVGFINAIANRRDIVCIEHTCQACGDEACTFELLPATEAQETAVVTFDPDPFLSQQLNLLDILFDRMPMGIALFDRELRIRRFNPTWAGFIGRYTAASTSDVVAGVHFFDLLPDVKDDILPLFQRVLAGETVQQTAMPSTSGGITSYWDVTFTPLIENGEVVGILDVVIDATERQQMVSELQQNEANLRSMLESAKGYVVYRVAVDAHNPYLGRVVLVSPSIRDVIGINDPHRFESWFESVHPDDMERVVAANRRAFEKGIPFDETMRFFDQRSQEWRWIHTVSNPVYDRAAQLTHFNGIIMDVTDQKRAEETLAQVNVMLEQKVRERTQELSTLLEVSQNVASTLELQPLLGVVLDQLRAVVSYDGASIFELQDDLLRLLAYRGPIPTDKARRLVFSLAEAGANRAVIQQQQPIIISDVLGETALARAFRETAAAELETTFGYVRSWMGVPLILRGKVLGMISLDHSQPDFYGEAAAQLAQAFASQVAVFIENGRLYTETRQRADETRTLFNVQQAITSRLDPDVVLQMVADEARRLTATEMSAVYLLDGDELEIKVVSGDVAQQTVGYRLPVAHSIAGMVTQTQRPFLVTDASQEQHAHQELVDRVGAQSFVIVPLMSGQHAIGTITVANKQDGVLGPEDERVLAMMATGAVIALENAHLYEKEHARREESERRRQAAEGLRDILARLNSGQLLPQLLDAIVGQADLLLDSDVVALYLLQESGNELQIQASRGELQAIIKEMVLPVGVGTVGRVVAERRPMMVPDVGQLPIHQRKEPAYRRETAVFVDPQRQEALQVAMRQFQAVLALPLVAQDTIYGGLAFYYHQPHPFSDEEVNLATTFAGQAALAIQNARLRQNAEQMAVVAERNRLARELHDAVTQTLFSASLIADVLPRIWEKDAQQGQARLAELRELTRGALAEMRTLLLELRPATLTESSLGELLRQLTEAVIGRSRLPVKLSIEGERPLPPEIQVALYRIAQEALNNIVKHAAASEVAITLIFAATEVIMTITDNGRGFDVADVGVQSLGLSIMRERAEKIEATLAIDSKIGKGTTIGVRVGA